MWLSKIKFFIPLLALFIVSTTSMANDKRAILMLDMRNKPELPRHFRVATRISPDMRMAGGGQFSELSLKKILQTLHVKRLLIIDLRQESHGFLNGNAISWYGYQDAANAGKTPEQINEEQMRLLLGLLAKKTVKVNQVLSKTESGATSTVKPLEFAVHGVYSESELASKYHLSYKRFYVQDFHAPTPIEVDRMVQTIKNLPKDKWIYVHCHAGVGRTTTFMVMFDMMRNAKQVSFEDILFRQKEIGGKDLEDLPVESSFKYEWAQERLAFLKRFYEYVRDNEDNFQQPWSQWITQHPLHTESSSSELPQPFSVLSMNEDSLLV